MAKGKKSAFLSEDAIQSLERLGDEQIKEHLRSQEQGALVTLVVRLLMSYRLAARVANAAWAFVESKGLDGLDQLTRCLHDYAPTHFSQHAGDLEVLVDELGILLADMQGLTSDECRNLVALRLEMYAGALNKARAMVTSTAVPRTPR